MGFTQDQAVRALRASFDNVDQAIELLLNDPDNIGPPRTAEAPPLSRPNGFPADGSGLASGLGYQPSGYQPSYGPPPSVVPPNLMNMVAQQQRQQEVPDLSSMSLGALGGLGGALGGGAGGGAAPQAATGEVTIEQIEEIRRMVAFTPILTGPLLEQLKEEDPDMYNYIDNDPEKLLLAFARGGAESGPTDDSTNPTSLVPPLPPASARPPAFAPMPAPVPQGVPAAQTQTISVTQEEAEQIERIMELGFDKQAVLQAYVASERDAERAAEFLLAGAF